MKKDIFSDWLKEFCMLVFIQTIQAFIFAIVMSLILSLISGNFGDPDNALGSTGLIAVIILASVSKIEDIVKKIFAVKSNFHDSGMRGGLKSLATTMMAANLAKGVTDNFKKVAGGVTGFVGANKGIARQRARMARDINRYGTSNASSVGADGSSNPALNPSKDLTQEDYMEKAKEAKKNGDMRGYEKNRGIAAGMRKTSESSGSSLSNSDKLQEKMDAYDDKIRELKQKRRASVISVASGLNESVGAVAGGISGAAFGAAMGEAKEIIQAGGIGLGIGDKMGSLATRPLSAPGAISDLTSDIKGWRQSNKEFEKEISSFNSTTREAINARDKQIKSVSMAKKKLNDALKDINAGNMDA